MPRNPVVDFRDARQLLGMSSSCGGHDGMSRGEDQGRMDALVVLVHGAGVHVVRKAILCARQRCYRRREAKLTPAPSWM